MSSKRVTGIGGIFFKSKDPARLRQWYEEHLGFTTDNYGTNFEWRRPDNPDQKGFSVWAPFEDDTKYFQPSGKEFMINFRVENLGELLEALKKEGITILDAVEVFDYGKFVHIMDPEGTKIELWEPNDIAYEKMIGDKRMS